MTRPWLALALLLAGCVSDHTLGVELRPPRAPDGGPDVPADVAVFEVRLSRLEEGEGCPTVDEAASATGPGRLGHAQSFTAEDGMGMAIGEVPPGRWALAALARDDACAVRLYGCAEVSIDADAPASVVVEMVETASTETCGACRSCESGACAPVDVSCE